MHRTIVEFPEHPDWGNDSFSRLVQAAENIAMALEELRLLKEHELQVRVVYEGGDPRVEELKGR